MLLNYQACMCYNKWHPNLRESEGPTVTSKFTRTKHKHCFFSYYLGTTMYSESFHLTMLVVVLIVMFLVTILHFFGNYFAIPWWQLVILKKQPSEKINKNYKNFASLHTVSIPSTTIIKFRSRTFWSRVVNCVNTHIDARVFTQVATRLYKLLICLEQAWF
jgi:hypothetical protein